VKHFFTVDVEEYFHVNAFDRVISREAWTTWPQRLDRSIPILLQELDRAGATATFFVLGWVADKNPDVVLEIARAGHEIASHGYSHRRVDTMSPAEFRDDVRSAKLRLEDLVGEDVVGYRAPSFSIGVDSAWAFDVLLEEGYTYDSSFFPGRHSGTASLWPHPVTRPAGTLTEFPLAAATIAGIPIPAAGGGYLRHLPFALVRRAFQQAEERGMPASFYIHPWEIDPDQPLVPVGIVTRMRHYRGLAHCLGRIRRLLSEFRFQSIRAGLLQRNPISDRRMTVP
jgi:polysaccharide deacetylase family protein (PEP-CTERM system associated)